MFEIQKNHPIPPRNRRVLAEKTKEFLMSLQIGDSFFMPFNNEDKDSKTYSKQGRALSSMVGYMRKSDKYPTFNATIRLVREQEQYGLRVWRIAIKAPTSAEPAEPAEA
jgi:hypothetical protein